MSHKDAEYRKYEKMGPDGLRPMNNKEIVEEAICTVRSGKRRGIRGKDDLEQYFNTGRRDESLGRDGLVDLQCGLEMLLKGIIQYYGESYKQEHYTDRNGEILEGLSRQFPELRDLYDAFAILQDDDFSFTMYKCSKFPKYQSYKTHKQFRSLAYKLLDLFINYANTYILID